MANPEYNGYWFNVANIEFVGPIHVTGVGGESTFEIGLNSGKSLTMRFNSERMAKTNRSKLTATIDAGAKQPD